MGYPVSQICLSVKILSVDVAETRGIAAVKKKDVCGDLLVVGQLDGDVEGEGDDDLEDDDERPEARKPVRRGSSWSKERRQ